MTKHEVFVSGSEDGAHIYCTAEACMRTITAPLGGANWQFRKVWWTEEVPYGATPEQVLEWANLHRAT